MESLAADQVGLWERMPGSIQYFLPSYDKNYSFRNK